MTFNKFNKKIIILFLLLTLVGLFSVAPQEVKALTAKQIQARIAEIKTLIVQLQKQLAQIQKKEVKEVEPKAESSKVEPPELKYAPGELVVKFSSKVGPYVEEVMAEKKDFQSITGSPALDNLFSKYEVAKAEPVFKELHNKIKTQELSFQQIIDRIKAKYPKRTARALKDASIPDLSNIYKLEVPEDTDIQRTAAEFAQDPDVVYAEPNYIVHTFEGSNDPYYGSIGAWRQDYFDMWGLRKVEAGQAWDIEKGESNEVVVAVIDTGIDFSHQDIAANLWQNEDEEIGDANDDGYPGIAGVDDDGDGLIDEDSEGREPGDPGYTNDLKDDDDENGYVDDTQGWDFHNGDNDPTDGHGHGTHSAGTIAAVTNNDLGVAGISWHADIMPLKGLSDGGRGYIDRLVNAIEYAANNGADVLSNSWGGEGTSEALQEAFDYAYGLGCVLVAAAGNSNEDAAGFHPANIPSVMAVSATDKDDIKAPFSNWGEIVDVSAPGVNVLSLRAAGTDMYGDGKHIVGENYYYASGTSMACPHVSGLAALLISQNPDWTNDQVRERIKDSADNIDALNPDWEGLLGTGRINAYKALATESSPSIILTYFSIDDSAGNNNGYIDPGETINLIVTLKNTWLDATGVTATLSSADPLVTIINDSSDFGDMPTGESKDNADSPYSFSVDPDAPRGHRLFFTLEVNTTGDYNNTEIFNILIPEFSLRYYTYDIDDNMGNDNGIIDPGESVDLIVTLENDGLLDITGVSAILSTEDPYTTITDDSSEFGDIPSEETADNSADPYSISVDEETPIGHWINFSLDIDTTSDDYTKEEIFKVRVPIPPQVGWPQETEPGYSVDGSPALVDIDGDHYLEVVITGSVGIYAWNFDGTPVDGWPQRAAFFFLSASPALGDIDGDHDIEIIAGAAGQDDGIVYAYHHNGTPVEGWPKFVPNQITSPPVLGDLDGDGILDIIVNPEGPWIYAWRYDGTAIPGWPVMLPNGSRNGYTPAIGDLDGDGKLEVVVSGSVPGAGDRIYIFNHDGTLALEFEPGPPFLASPATLSLGDIDGDGDLEVVGGAWSMFAWHHDGTPVEGWPIYSDEIVGHTSVNGPAVVDIDGDLKAEIIVGTHNGRVYAWYGDTTPIEGWPVETKDYPEGVIFGAPAVANIDGDTDMEVVVGSGHEAYVYAWHSNGEPVDGWPVETGGKIYSSPAIGDLDKDGDMEVVVGSRDSKVYVWDIPWDIPDIPGPGEMQWPMFRHDPQRTGQYKKPSIIDIDINLTDGWNMISFPGTPLNSDPESLPGEDSSIVLPLYKWNALSAGYEQVIELKPGEGYWILTLEDETLNVPLIPIDSITLDLKQGWNMIGGVSTTVDISDPQDDPDGCVTLPALWFDPVERVYATTTQIEPGKGYWLGASQDCTLTLEEGAVPEVHEKLYKITPTITKTKLGIPQSPNFLPIAKAKATPQKGYSPLKVQFSSKGSYDPLGEIVSFHWDFGDGSQSDKANPIHIYEFPADSSDQTKVYTATLTVFDNRGATSTDQVNIALLPSLPSNRAPVLDSIGDKEIEEGKLLEFTITASDPDKDPLTYSASNLPDGATFVGQTFSWRPSSGRAGVYPNVHFEVSDGKLTDSEDIIITVIAKPESLTVVSPNGGEEWTTGTTHNITWQSQGVTKVTIYLYDYGATEKKPYTIATGVSSGSTGGSYSWTISNSYPVSTKLKVEIQDYHSNLSDLSNSYFSITEEKGECWTNKDCSSAQFCEFAEGTCQGPGTCVKKPASCVMVYEPVCGCDNNTYSNDCHRQRAGVSKKYDGACTRQRTLRRMKEYLAAIAQLIPELTKKIENLLKR